MQFVLIANEQVTFFSVSLIYAINNCFRLPVDTWFGVEAGAFYDCIIPETIEELWGPIPLGKIDKMRYLLLKINIKVEILQAKNMQPIIYIVIAIRWRIAFAVYWVLFPHNYTFTI